jgi:hypothetical protein
LATIFIFIRSYFRVAELSGGFDSALANDQITFMVLEGAMIVSVSHCLALFHRGKALWGWLEKYRVYIPYWGRVELSEVAGVWDRVLELYDLMIVKELIIRRFTQPYCTQT